MKIKINTEPEFAEINRSKVTLKLAEQFGITITAADYDLENKTYEMEFDDRITDVMQKQILNIAVSVCGGSGNVGVGVGVGLGLGLGLGGRDVRAGGSGRSRVSSGGGVGSKNFIIKNGVGDDDAILRIRIYFNEKYPGLHKDMYRVFDKSFSRGILDRGLKFLEDNSNGGEHGYAEYVLGNLVGKSLYSILTTCKNFAVNKWYSHHLGPKKVDWDREFYLWSGKWSVDVTHSDGRVERIIDYS